MTMTTKERKQFYSREISMLMDTKCRDCVFKYQGESDSPCLNTCKVGEQLRELGLKYSGSEEAYYGEKKDQKKYIDEKLARKYLKQGMPIKDMAAKFDMSTPTLRKRLREMGLRIVFKK